MIINNEKLSAMKNGRKIAIYIIDSNAMSQKYYKLNKDPFRHAGDNICCRTLSVSTVPVTKSTVTSKCKDTSMIPVNATMVCYNAGNTITLIQILGPH